MHQGMLFGGRAEDVRVLPKAIRTAAESMAVTPLRLTNAVGMPWRRVCSARSTQAHAASSAARQSGAGGQRWTGACRPWKKERVEPDYALKAFCSGALRYVQRRGCFLVQRKASALGNIGTLAGARGGC
jgi:hypothetical protein